MLLAPLAAWFIMLGLGGLGISVAFLPVLGICAGIAILLSAASSSSS